MKVSACIITYNQEEYISQCLDGVLSQIVDFDYEIIIGEDKSTDGTLEICKKYADKHPTKITLIERSENLGMIGNWLETIMSCKGKYIALCEGDDYWTDPLKLQKQVDFLEANDEFALCFHPVKILKKDGEIEDDFITKIPENFQERMTLASNSNYIHTPSVVFRNIVEKELHTMEFKNSPIGDYFLYLIISKYGKIGYLEDNMAVYRFGVGVFSAISTAKQRSANLLLYINLYAVEKNEIIKEIFYKNILNLVQFSENKLVELDYRQKLLNTRRHSAIERLYSLMKKVLLYIGIAK
ncbi:Glycosyltransferase involved in cell wall bisynthesis [Halpernia humi]|uniref:Glycosyltransferase involved in cell wall bisynthesis n=1 Tax=Halpernia humi TaxID=493375 RepID=A0A1H5W4I3_9FLAO|nr:glycosyltransferase [Halpernia humi]SEF94444.1 Glycosyltransferase involved in cell wall bisynthesis [Halpernia humi]